MNKKITIAACIGLAFAGMANATPTQLGNTGEYFEYFSTNESWAAAKNDAASKTFMGMQGRLAVVLNAAENALITSLINAANGRAAWVGATNTFANNQETWTWLTGETWVTQLGGINLTPGVYTNWNGGEPNNAGNSINGFHEDALQIYANGTWNDLGGPDYGYQTPGYIVQYKASNIPEPSAIGLLAISLLGFIGARRQKKQA